MESFATPYQVVFFDGEQEHDKGVVGVHSVLTFKRFQVLMSQKIGIPANQLSAVFVCRRTLKDDKRQKLPINENTNFNIILNQHNPSREKDCHFLVSIKKSKKERKVTRKRSAEAGNADDEDSNSSRGDLSPSDERPKPGSGTDDPCSLEAASPPVFLQRPPSPVTPLATSNGCTVRNVSPNGKVSMAAPEGKVERTLLRREGMGPNGFASPRPGWQYGGAGLGQRIEGFSLPSTGKVERSQVRNAEDCQKLENKPWMHEEGTEFARQSEKANGQAATQQPESEHHHLQAPLVELFRQNKFNDSTTPQSLGLKPLTGVTRNGMIVPASGLNVTPCTASLSNNLAPIARPSANLSSVGSANGNFFPRASVIVGENRARILHQAQTEAQVQISHLQQQHQQPPVSMTPLELSKLSGVLQGLVGRDSRAESTKTCKLCCFCRERNIGEPPFHWCVDDTILMGFRGPSPAGPIGRPGKRHVEAAA
ncbi:unnamed protein product [Sphagnum compactum]